MDIKIPVEFPALDLSTLLPLAALVAIAALILVTLMARSIIRSRLVAIAVIVAIVMAGSTTIVGGIGAVTTLIAVAGGVIIVGTLVLNRSQDVLDLLHIAITRREPPAQIRQQPPVMLDEAYRQPSQLAAPGQQHYLPAPRPAAPERKASSRTMRLPKDWGF